MIEQCYYEDNEHHCPFDEAHHPEDATNKPEVNRVHRWNGGTLKEVFERIDRDIMVEDHDVVVRFDDRIPIDHTRATIAHHPPKGHIRREL